MMDAQNSKEGISSTGIRGVLRDRGFAALLATVFLGSVNDNAFKLILSLLIISAAATKGGAGQNLALTGAVFVLPFILLAGYTGQTADRFSKTSVLRLAKAAELVALGLGLFVLSTPSIGRLFGILFLLAVRGAFFSPAQAGIVPEILPQTELSRANGLIGLSSFTAIILGSALGSFLMATFHDRLWLVGTVLAGIAGLGYCTSLYIPRTGLPNLVRPVNMHPFREIGQGLRGLWKNSSLNLAVTGTAYFWFVGALLQMSILLLCMERFHASSLSTGFCMTTLALGIGSGCLSAALISKDRIETGIVPCACLSLAGFSLCLALSQSLTVTLGLLLATGFSGGLFIVPLNALIQHKSEAPERGRLLATTNFVNMLGVVFASAAFWIERDFLGFSAGTVLAIGSLFTLCVTAYLIHLAPEPFVRFLLLHIVRTLFRIRVVAAGNVPSEGGALLVSNHISFADAFILSCATDRPIRFLMFRPYFEVPVARTIFKLLRAIPISSDRPSKEAVRILQESANHIRGGDLVGIFPEGMRTRTGSLEIFRRGAERIASFAGCPPIIPMYIHGLWGIPSSLKQQKSMRDYLLFRRPVTVIVGSPFTEPVTMAALHSRIQQLSRQFERATLELTTRTEHETSVESAPALP